MGRIDSPVEHEVANACGRRWINHVPPTKSHRSHKVCRVQLTAHQMFTAWTAEGGTSITYRTINKSLQWIMRSPARQVEWKEQNYLEAAATRLEKRVQMGRHSAAGMLTAGTARLCPPPRASHVSRSEHEDSMMLNQYSATTARRVPTIHRAKRGSYSKSMCIISWSFRRGPLSTATLLQVWHKKGLQRGGPLSAVPLFKVWHRKDLQDFSPTTTPDQQPWNGT